MTKHTIGDDHISPLSSRDVANHTPLGDTFEFFQKLFYFRIYFLE